MYTDPWDLKHSIQQMQQQQKHQSRLISNNKYTSQTYTDQLNEHPTEHPDTNIQLSQYQPEDQTNSDQHVSQFTNNNSYAKPMSDTIHSGYEVEFVPQPRDLKPRKKYGNLIVFLQTNSTILSIGPNYVFFFLAYLCFTLSSLYLVHLVNTSVENIKFKIFNFAFCALQNLSYLLVAFSNPGVKLPQSNYAKSIEQSQQRHCKSCGAYQQRKTYHCRVCDICVTNYDHHCPWTSKCIGGGNLKRFYFFVCMTPFYIFYYVVAFMICMASLTLPHAKQANPIMPPSVL